MQDIGGDEALGAASDQHHDHVAPGAHILDLVGQVLELLEIQGADHRALKLRDEAMLGARRIEAFEIVLAVQRKT